MTAATYGDDDKTPSLLKAAWLIAVVTIFSKLIGFIRDVVIANYYGASMVSDAYFYAYQIPALSIILLGDIDTTDRLIFRVKVSHDDLLF